MANKFLYLKLYDTVRAEIESGALAPGSKLPGETELRERFQVSAITIKKAMSMLADEDYVRRVPGRGTFVRGSLEPELPPTLAPYHAYRARLVGLVMECVSTPFGLEMVYAIDKALYAQGYRLCVRFSYADRARETEELTFLQSLGAVGILIMPCYGNYYNPTLLRLILDDFPIVLVDKKLLGIPAPSIHTDNRAAAATLVRHLFDCGSRRIGLLTVETAETNSLQDRAEGFCEERTQLGLPECPACYVPMPQDLTSTAPDDAICEGIRVYLAAHRDEIDALVCTEYCLTMCLTRVAEEMGIALGADGLRVCGIDEDYLAPGGCTVTHVRQDEAAIAARAVELLLLRMEGQELPLEECAIPGIFRRGKTT